IPTTWYASLRDKPSSYYGVQCKLHVRCSSLRQECLKCCIMSMAKIAVT
ncbi:6832_t:CDS:1, partial [Dentiscutata erythropus]